MSHYIKKYNITFDSNMGFTCHKSIYCYYDNCCDFQKWCNEDGTPLDFGCVTDDEAMVTAKCIAGIPTNDKFSYWEEDEIKELHQEVVEFFN